ncbi:MULTISPECIES: SUKH-3 domain-containing protein [Chryseobacterium]|uniref:Knr4/Smi1-like domain-containing protein n=1 Tax=Chryseobacterium candidae TaxID=1978493 RepID=A0ABY2R2T2_9FLAO|nr:MULTISPECIES: SUKH-3 domain-containing protein [Chryseobacterium]THV56521.1 hypothetical protein EK417_17540 [Chryseobacterium candidae]SIQ27148.1 SUKH-3 immunity protein [Chryseobacterium sp. RU33C]
MEFKKEVQKQFKKAGWFEGRNIENKLNQKIKNFYNLPSHLKDFFKSYGDLVIEDNKPYKSDVINTLNTKSEFVKDNETNELPFNGTFYKVGYFYPDHYLVYTDVNGAIYLIGDGYYKMNDGFIAGIENIIEDNWGNSLEWNPETKQWVEEY